MKKTRANTIKGLSIANIVLSSIWLILIVVCGVALMAIIQSYDTIVSSIGSSSLGYSGDFMSAHHGYSYGFEDPYYYGYDMEYDDLIDSGLLFVVLNAGTWLLVLAFIMQAVSLSAGVIMLLNCNKPQKLGFAFGWGIVGAVLSLLSTGLVQGVLFILAAIFTYQDYKLYKNGQYPMETTAPAAAAPVMGQPTQPPYGYSASAPVQGQAPQYSATSTAAPVQPVSAVPQAPAQPMDAQSQQTMQVADELIDPAVTETTTIVETEVLSGANGDAAVPPVEDK